MVKSYEQGVDESLDADRPDVLVHCSRSFQSRVHSLHYHIAGMFGGVNVWRIAELKVIGEIKFGEWIDFGHKVLLLPAKIWLVKVWGITHDSPNSPNFPAAKHSCYTVSMIQAITDEL